jgi:hypothetical protein
MAEPIEVAGQLEKPNNNRRFFSSAPENSG